MVNFCIPGKINLFFTKHKLIQKEQILYGPKYRKSQIQENMTRNMAASEESRSLQEQYFRPRFHFDTGADSTFGK